MKRFPDQVKVALGRAHFLCLDCNLDTNKAEQYYMLRDGIWCSINPKIIGMLCLPCAERRLKRSLVREDFSSTPLNAEQSKICPELALRLSRSSPPPPNRLNRLKRRHRAKHGQRV